MNYKYTYIFIFIVLWEIIQTSALQAQRIYNGQITITPYELQQEGDSLYIDLDIDFSGLVIEKDRSLSLTPLLTSGNRSYEFGEILINGKTRHKIYKRQQALGISTYNNKPEPVFVVMSDAGARSTVRYQLALPFEDWMADARLDLREELCGCRGYQQQISVERLFSEITLEKKQPYRMDLRAAYIKPPVEEVKARSESHEVFLDFPVAQTTILPEFGNNPYELEKIRKLLQTTRDDKNLSVTRISIIGYASPEGGQAFNMQLSSGRAEALKNFLSMRAGFPPSLYWVDQGGEDWNGLAKLVEESNMQYKSEILAIINYTANPDERKYKLQALAGGVPYRHMLNELYPRLRRVVSQVSFTVKGFSLEESKEVFRRAPHQLSLEEMFLVANSYPADSREFSGVFETAVRLFPEDEVANLNAAGTALMNGNLRSAEDFLKKANKRTAEYKTNTALLYMKRGEYGPARTLLEEASAEGIEAARHNLIELEKMETSLSRTQRSSRR